MYKFFEEFLKKMASSFRRIAKATKHEVTEEDLKNDAWLLAHDIGKRRGQAINFSDPADQDMVIRFLHFKNVKRGDWKLRKAIRIDEESDDDENMPSWSEKLAAHESSDPLISILFRESAFNAETMFSNSYSQAVAYVRTFEYFKNNRKATCAHLAIAENTLAKRVTFAAKTVRVQPSLFDRIEKIADNFLPLRGRQYPVKTELHCSGLQFGWDFST
jgi:hypothetical protein